MFKFLVLSSLVAACMCSVYIIPGEIAKSRDHEGHCYYDQYKLLLKVGATTRTDKCEEISCHDDFSISIFGCGSFSLYDPKCKRFEKDYSKPYPVCCTSFICVEPVEGISSDSLNQIERNTLD